MHYRYFFFALVVSVTSVFARAESVTLDPAALARDWTLEMRVKVNPEGTRKWGHIACLRRADTVNQNGGPGEASYVFDVQVTEEPTRPRCIWKVRTDTQIPAANRMGEGFNAAAANGVLRWNAWTDIVLVWEAAARRLDVYQNGMLISHGRASANPLQIDAPKEAGRVVLGAGAACSFDLFRLTPRCLKPDEFAHPHVVGERRLRKLPRYAETNRYTIAAAPDFERVRDAIREVHAREPGKPCVVTVKAGRHLRTAPFELDDADTDTVYIGVPGAIVSGARTLDGWTAAQDAHGTVWSAPVPGLKVGQVYFNQLWVNGRRATLARWPKAQKGWTYGTKRLDFLRPKAVKQTLETNAVTKAETATQLLTGHAGELDVLRGLSPTALADVSLVVCHNWDVTRRAVNGFDAATGTLTTRGRRFKPWNPWRTASIYYLENVPAACTEPGDWHLDREQGLIFYRPLPGESLATARLEIPRQGLSCLVELDGAAGVTFRNLVFEGTEVPSPRVAEPMQAAFSAGAAVLADRSDEIVFEACTFRHMGEYALWFRDACSGCRAVRCHVHDMGAGGLRMGGTVKACPSTALETRNCRIEDCGLVNPCGVGLWIGEPQRSVFTHNHIRRTRYSGVSMGWNWGYAGVGVRNDLSFNLIEDVGLGGLTDEGAIYTLGRQDGTVIHDNVLRRVDGYTFCRWALYFDQGTTGVTAYNNLCHDAVDGGFTFHYGRDNVVSNNIFATGLANHMVNVGRAEKFRMLEFTRNIVWWDAADTYWDVRDRTVAYRDYGRDREPGTMVFASNIWWCANGEVKFRPGPFSRKETRIDGLLSFDRWRTAPYQAKDNDVGSIVADPLFVDPKHGDFRFRDESVARKIGFRPWDWTQAGLEKGVAPGAGER